MLIIILLHQISVTHHDLAFSRVTFLTTFTTWKEITGPPSSFQTVEISLEE